ncbi:MAG: pyridoxal 5'-phosphate synthase glutaminase subunit PdxT [Kiritimatiellia bacterium]
MRVGVLALQGAFIEHESRIAELGATPFEIRTRTDVESPFDGLILPGGESTVQGKLLHELELFDPLRRMIGAGLPVFGTCAGLILLARRIQDDPLVHFGSLDVVVERNAYGRQLGSFQAEGPFAGGASIPMSFIRAPAIREVGSGVDVLASENGIPVAVRQGNILATAFHPELDPDTTIHSYFLSMVEEFVVS